MSEGSERRRRIINLAQHAIAHGAVVLDTETTGLNYDDEIVEVAVVDAPGTLQFSALVKPSKPIPPDATAIHGITNEMVAQARTWPEIWPTVKEIVGARSLFAYNSDFDARMVRQTSKIYELDQISSWLCLMNLWIEYHGLERWQRLDNVCYEIGIAPGGHRALGDAMAAREVLRWLAKQEA